MFLARETVFLEQEFVSRRQSGRKFELDGVQEEPQMDTDQILEENDPSNSEAVDIHSAPRRSGRVSRAPERYLGNVDQDADSILLLLESDEPKTYKAAVSSPDSKLWIDAMQSEMDSMYDNQVWELVDLPQDIRPLQCKWIFKIKVGLDSKPSVYKARLVAKGFTQVHGIHYEETFAPVAMLRSIRILLAIAGF